LFEKKVKGGRRLALTIGTYPEWTLAEARAEALRIELEAQAGIDRVKIANEHRTARAAAEAQARTVGDLLEIYISQHVQVNLKPGRSRLERERQLRACFAELSGLRLADLKRGDLQKIVDGKAAEGKHVMANRLSAAVCAFTAWCWRRDFIDVDPGAKVQKSAKEKARTRTPSVAEVREIWAATCEMGPIWGPLFRLLILTGQRRSEIAEMRWDWVNTTEQQLEIPDSKNNRPHLVHLAEAAFTELHSVQERQVKSGRKELFVFTTTGHSPVSGTSKSLERLREKINSARSVEGRPAMAHWTLHDLRRSMATALAGAGFAESVVDRIQNHVAAGSRPSQVSAVYQLNEMLAERARALRHWAAVVTSHENDAA
jgi:integrase